MPNVDAKAELKTLAQGGAGDGRLLVASYCTHFLKLEMRHVYRQVCGFRRVRTFVIAKYRENAGMYPFPDVEQLGSPRVAPWVRAVGKYLRREPPLVYRGEYEALRRILIKRDPDLMHVYFGNTGVHLLPLLQVWDRPTVLSFHGMDVQDRPSEKGYLGRLRAAFAACALLLVRSRSIERRLVELGCPPAKIRLNRTGVPSHDFPEVDRSPPDEGAWHVVQACRLVPKKGLPTALRAFAAFAADRPNATFTIAGSGPLRDELGRLADGLGLAGRVRFAGFLDQEGLRELYEGAHIFLHPSEVTPDANQEGVPNSMLEAMASGLPVVATVHGGIPEAVTDGEEGLLVPEGDAAAAAAALRRICGDVALWSRLRRAAARRVRQEWSQEVQIGRLESVYAEAVAGWREGRRKP